MKTVTIIYEGRRHNNAVWFHFDREKNKMVGEALWFKPNKLTTRFPPGMIIDIEHDDKNRWRFADAKWGEIWDNDEVVNQMVLSDQMEKQKLSVKRTENKLKKELGENWQELTIKQFREQYIFMTGVNKQNALALLLKSLT